jgi:hypothetical protein
MASGDYTVHAIALCQKCYSIVKQEFFCSVSEFCLIYIYICITEEVEAMLFIITKLKNEQKLCSKINEQKWIDR